MNMNDAFVGSLIFNRNGGGGGASAMSDLTDVAITSPSEGETLIYDSTSEKWVNGQGGGKQTALTQAEYDALVQAGTVDPTMEYFITDGIPASVKYYHNYSTDEHIVGKWIDGKTLYERTFYSTTKYGSSDTALVLNNQIPSNIDVIHIRTQLNIEARDGGNVYKFASASAGWFAAYYDILNNTFYAKQTLSSVSNVTSCLTYVILQYTKTSS